MAEYNVRPLYDTSGMARGIMAAGQGIAAGITGLSNRRHEDQQRQQNRQWDIEDRDFQAAQQENLWTRREQAAEADRAAEKAAKEQERNAKREAEENATLGRMAGLASAAPELFSAEELKTYGRMNPAQLRGVLKVKEVMLGEYLKEEHAKKKAESDRRTYPLADPATGQPVPGVAMTGNGQVLRYGQEDVPDMEALRAMGMRPTKAKINGMEFAADPPPDKPAVPIYTDKGTLKSFEPLPDGWVIDENGKPMPLPEGVSRLAWREMQAQKRRGGNGSAPASSTNRLNELNSRLQGIQ